MAYRVSFSPTEGLGVVELTGTVRWVDLETVMKVLFEDPHWAPEFDALWDASRLVSADITPDDLPDVRETISHYEPDRKGGRSAIVARRSTELMLANLFSRFGRTPDRQVEVFEDLPTALAFLDRTALPETLQVIAESPR